MFILSLFNILFRAFQIKVKKYFNSLKEKLNECPNESFACLQNSTSTHFVLKQNDFCFHRSIKTWDAGY